MEKVTLCKGAAHVKLVTCLVGALNPVSHRGLHRSGPHPCKTGELLGITFAEQVPMRRDCPCRQSGLLGLAPHVERVTLCKGAACVEQAPRTRDSPCGTGNTD